MLRVTRALELAGLVDTEWCTDAGLKRGTAVHEAVRLDIKKDLDEASLHPEVAPRLESWRAYLRESGAIVEASELEVVHAPMLYAGRLDLLLWIKKPSDNEFKLYVVDLKCGPEAPSHRIQLAAYAMAWAAVWGHLYGQPAPRRAGLYLQPDGKAARSVEFDDRRDFETWKGVLSVAHFRMKHGLT